MQKIISVPIKILNHRKNQISYASADPSLKLARDLEGFDYTEFLENLNKKIDRFSNEQMTTGLIIGKTRWEFEGENRGHVLKSVSINPYIDTIYGCGHD
jgi:hypothetical protein